MTPVMRKTLGSLRHLRSCVMSKELIQQKISVFLSKSKSAEKKPEETSLKRKLSDSTAEGDMADQANKYQKSYAGVVSSDPKTGASSRSSSFQNSDHQNNYKQGRTEGTYNSGRTECTPLTGQKQLSSGSDRNRRDSNPSPGIQDEHDIFANPDANDDGETQGSCLSLQAQKLSSSPSDEHDIFANPDANDDGETQGSCFPLQAQKLSSSLSDKKSNTGSTGWIGQNQLSSGSDRNRRDSDRSPGIQENAHSFYAAEGSYRQDQGGRQGCSKNDFNRRVWSTGNTSATLYENGRPWQGVNIKELKRAPKCFKENGMSLPPLRASKDHKVFFDIPDDGWNDTIPTPHRGNVYWDDSHVFMPNSEKNEMPENGRVCSRWGKIEQTLEGTISDSFDLASAILKYNPHYKNRWNFDSLHGFFEANGDLKIEFFGKILPKMQYLALRLPKLCPMTIPILKQGRNMKLTFSQEQIACLLANAFFCTFPKRNFKSKHCRLPDINFSNLYIESHDSCRAEKLNCIVNYFRRVTEDMPRGTVTYARQHVVDDHDWPEMHKRFSSLHVSTTGTIEDDGWGMLQADFANKYVGGGVLGHGLVQEEIRFVICPEMILSRLFTEVLGDKEVLIMTGCERFSSYEGYSRSFKYSGDYVDNTERDEWGRRYVEVVAMDALVFRGFTSQFEKDKIFRELNKAYCAFTGNQFTQHLPAVCTGNWGCGAFGGDKQLKAIIQWMAASAVDRDVCYLTFADAQLCDQLGQLYTLFNANGIQISDVLGFIKRYCDSLKKYSTERQTLFQFIASMFGEKLEPYIAEENSNQDNASLEDSGETNMDDE